MNSLLLSSNKKFIWTITRHCSKDSTVQRYFNPMNKLFTKVLAKVAGEQSAVTGTDNPGYPDDVTFDGSSEANPCTGCAGDSCVYNSDLPPVLAKKISAESMLGSVKPYRLHIVVCRRGTGSTWPAKLESDTERTPSRGLDVHDVHKLVESLKISDSLGANVLVTAAERYYNWNSRVDETQETVQDLKAASDSEEVARLEGKAELLVFPHGLSISDVNGVDELEPLLKPLALMKDGCFTLERYLQLVEDKALANSRVRCLSEGSGLEAVGLVCGHNNRDKRCGVMGPILLDAFYREIEERQWGDRISVYLSSHYSGHKFAGNVVFYELKNLTNKSRKVTRNGHWYGRVSARHVPVIMDKHFGKGQVVQELWRGQMEMF